MKPHERPNCYLCGVLLDKANRSRDHVPPKGLFPRPFVSAPLLVPCCRDCNSAKSKDEEFFRMIACLGLNTNREKTKLYEQRVLPRTLGRGRLSPEIIKMMSGIKHRWIEVNGVYVNAGVVSVPKAPLERVAARIARGLLAYQQPALQVHSLSFDAYLATRETIWETIAQVGSSFKELRLGGRVFHALFASAEDNPSAGMFLMNFHETICMAVFHFDECSPRSESAKESQPN